MVDQQSEEEGANQSFDSTRSQLIEYMSCDITLEDGFVSAKHHFVVDLWGLSDNLTNEFYWEVPNAHTRQIENVRACEENGVPNCGMQLVKKFDVLPLTEGPSKGGSKLVFYYNEALLRGSRKRLEFSYDAPATPVSPVSKDGKASGFYQAHITRREIVTSFSLVIVFPKGTLIDGWQPLGEKKGSTVTFTQSNLEPLKPYLFGVLFRRRIWLRQTLLYLALAIGGAVVALAVKGTVSFLWNVTKIVIKTLTAQGGGGSSG